LEWHEQLILKMETLKSPGNFWQKKKNVNREKVRILTKKEKGLKLSRIFRPKRQEQKKMVTALIGLGKSDFVSHGSHGEPTAGAKRTNLGGPKKKGFGPSS